jgi:hypothetical protein
MLPRARARQWAMRALRLQSWRQLARAGRGSAEKPTQLSHAVSVRTSAGEENCGGASFCPHHRRRTECKECGGASICPHQRIRSQCRECRVQTTGGGPEDDEAGVLALVPRDGPPKKRQKTVLKVLASLMPHDAGAVSAPGTNRAIASVGVPKSQLCTAAAAAPLLEPEGMSQQQRALLVLRHGPSDRLQGVAIVATILRYIATLCTLPRRCGGHSSCDGNPSSDVRVRRTGANVRSGVSRWRPAWKEPSSNNCKASTRILWKLFVSSLRAVVVWSLLFKCWICEKCSRAALQGT